MRVKAPEGKVLIKMDTRQKERYSFDDGTTIHISKGYDFNLRQDKSSMAIILDGENLPAGEEILVHHNSQEPSYEVTELNDFLTDKEILDGYKIFSIPIDMCFIYSQNNEWHPCVDYLITERIFKPYKGCLVGIEPEIVKNRMYIVKGFDVYDGEKTDLSGKVAITTDNCDYEIIFHSTDNKEHHIIRTRHRELQGIDNDTLKLVQDGELLVGIDIKTAKTLK